MCYRDPSNVGTIAPELAELDELQFLELNGNFLVGHIPPVLGNLLNLVSLDLSHNFLSGAIPLGFDNFIRGKLKFLRLEVNSLTGPISWNLGFVPLYVFNVSYNHLEGFVSPSFSKYSIRSPC
ncbi:hypothetical protein KP509_35G001800 [Ceratopteris richardii]|uniref:Uncharacterized protein n=1 Tax=Ceratopteris richardii TaxID=49495 RepID=A0A8T2QFF4_CERRI|nr:hypothetical protein KP509_35G001800 [Ceratopteris richardii]